MKVTIISILAVSLVLSCGKDDKDKGGDKFKSGIPAITPIVKASLPAGLEASTNLVKAFGECGAVATPEEAITCLQSRVFSKPTSGNANTYYLKWVAELDSRIAEMDTRFTEIPTCFTKTAVAFEASFNINSLDVKENLKFQCWESHTVPADVTGFQKMAIGIDSKGNVNLLLVTKFSADSGIALIGKADAAGKSADVWVLNTSATDTNVIRMIADKTAKTFTYNFAATDPSGNDFCQIFARSNGTDISIQTVPGGMTCGTATAFANSGCLSATDLTVAGTDCSELNSFPAGVLPATVMESAHISPDTATDALAIINTDFAALGIGELKANTPEEEGDEE